MERKETKEQDEEINTEKVELHVGTAVKRAIWAEIVRSPRRTSIVGQFSFVHELISLDSFVSTMMA